MQVLETHILSRSEGVVTVEFLGEGGEKIAVTMAGSDPRPTNGDTALIDRAKEMMVQCAVFETVEDRSEQQSNRDFSEPAKPESPSHSNIATMMACGSSRAWNSRTWRPCTTRRCVRRLICLTTRPPKVGSRAGPSGFATPTERSCCQSTSTRRNGRRRQRNEDRGGLRKDHAPVPITDMRYSTMRLHLSPAWARN